MNPIQVEENDVRVNLRTKHIYPSNTNECQSITFNDCTTLLLEYDGVLPYILIRHPTPYELDTYSRISLTSKDYWDSHSYQGFISLVKQHNIIINQPEITDPISSFLSFEHLSGLISTIPVLRNINDNYVLISAINSKWKNTLSVKELSRKWNIGLKTATRTLHTTIHKCIRMTGLLS